jgi:alkylation response protein AidB-like acyl-CoA dehydrogenase
MGAYLYATEAMLYMTTGFVDRGDEDIMLETALCKVFCSEYGFQAADDAMQIMGGEGFMTENELDRVWRDSRINTVVEGANEVMHSFVFAYGSKQLGEYLMGVKAKPFKHIGTALQIGAELFLGIRRPAPRITKLSPKLAHMQRALEQHVRDFSHQVKLMFKKHEEKLITNQMVQRRLSLMVMWIHAMACSLARVDRSIRAGINGETLEAELRTVEYICAFAGEEIEAARRGLYKNTDEPKRNGRAGLSRLTA